MGTKPFKELKEKINELMPYVIKKDKINPFNCGVSHEGDNKFKIDNATGVSLYYKLLNEYMGKKEYYENYPVEYIDSALRILIGKILYNEEKTDKYIKQFISNLNSKEDQEFTISAKLTNIGMDPMRYVIGCSTIHRAEENDLHMEIPDKFEIGDILITTTVKAKNKETALILAEHNFKTSMGILKLYYGSKRTAYLDTYDMDSKIRLGHSLQDNFLEWSADRRFPIVLGEDEYEQLLKHGLGNLTVNAEKTLSNRINKCMYWYGMGSDTSFVTDKIINHMIVLETLFKFDNEIKQSGHLIADRLSKFLYSSSMENRTMSYRDLKNIYHERSRTVHSGELSKNNVYAQKLEFYSTISLKLAITKINHYENSFEKFINSLE